MLCEDFCGRQLLLDQACACCGGSFGGATDGGEPVAAGVSCVSRVVDVLAINGGVGDMVCLVLSFDFLDCRSNLTKWCLVDDRESYTTSLGLLYNPLCLSLCLFVSKKADFLGVS